MHSILSLLVSVLFLLASHLPGLVNSIDFISDFLTGVPYYSLQTSADFLDDITDLNIKKLDDNTGFIKDTLLVFMKEQHSLPERYKAFKSVGGRCIGYLQPANLFVLKAPFDTLEAMEILVQRLEESESVLYAGGSFAFKREENYTPNDPFDDLEDGSDIWDESNPGGSTWWLEAVEARNAWGYAELFNDVKVGIIDSGFELEHEELAGKISFPKNWLKARNIPSSHGTHVAGIIAAKADNGVGISGLAPHAKLVCIDWQREPGQVWSENLSIIFGVGYSIKAGAGVINLSLGSSRFIPEGKSGYPKYAMDYEAGLISFYMAILLNQGHDFLMVQSAGNGDSKGKPVDAFNNGTFCCINAKNSKAHLLGIPTAEVLDRIIVVGSAENLSNARFRQVSYSNVGEQVDICAPGRQIYSCTDFANNDYEYKSGTSMAAPVVSATAGLVWSVSPKLKGSQVKAIVCDPANTRYTAAPTPVANRFWEDLTYEDLPLVNSKGAVEAAIKTVYDSLEVYGKAVDSEENPLACEIEVRGSVKTFKFSAAADGKFSFVLPRDNFSISFKTDEGLKEIILDDQGDQVVDLGFITLP